MKKADRIKAKIAANKELTKKIESLAFFGVDDFINNGNRYIKAIKERRMCCIINSVSSSGMSRTLSFNECAKGRQGYSYMNFWVFFKALGFTETKDGNFRIHGCGMDMVFYTNYTIIHNLCSLGFISKKQCAELAQQTPPCL